MSAQQLMEEAAVAAVNEVRLVGRISQEPTQRVLPSGDVIWSFRVVVPREPDRRGGANQVDALECSVWSGRVRRSVATWRPGDLVEVSGAVRRRFFRSAAGPASRTEIEVTAGRVLRRAP